ncbi:MAG TPA: hypothetical protein VFD16_00535 [Candidatus Saccharimonadales bacterium]|nr:hypothetical protein [Candidatus Saccharimonadales bacterium]
MHPRFISSVLSIVTLCIVIAAVSISFVEDEKWMGFILIILSVLCLLVLLPFKVKIKSVLPDIFFGIIDNGILAIFAIFGGHFAGVAGAIAGGVVGNSITDGIAGIFEGHLAEKLRARLVIEERTMLKSSVGKMAGCLLGAGVILSISSMLNF